MPPVKGEFQLSAQMSVFVEMSTYCIKVKYPVLRIWLHMNSTFILQMSIEERTNAAIKQVRKLHENKTKQQLN